MNTTIQSFPMRNPPVDENLGSNATALLHRKDVTEIYVNDDGYIRYQSYLDGKVKTTIYLPPDRIAAIIRFVAGQSGKIATADIPSVSTELQGYGARFQGELPPVVRNPQFNIRMRATKIFTLDDYVANGTLTPYYKTYIESAIQHRKNILIVGGTGTGKTTFLNAILDAIAHISPFHRIISLEDTPELQCPADDYSPMYTMQETNSQGIRFNMTRLLADCMRRSPDRIVVGEVRDGAAYTMLKAWNTGHEGGACTVHANGAEEGLTRINFLAKEDPYAAGDLHGLIGEAIDVVISITHTDLGNGKRGRRVNDIIEVTRYDEKAGQYILRHIHA